MQESTVFNATGDHRSLVLGVNRDKLFNKTLIDAKKSTRDAKANWKTQSSLISEYLAKMESETKKTSLKEQMAGEEAEGESEKGGAHRLVESVSMFPPYYYAECSDSSYRLCCIRPTSRLQENVLVQVNNFLEKYRYPTVNTYIPPENLCRRYWRNLDANPQVAHMEVFETVLNSELEQI